MSFSIHPNDNICLGIKVDCTFDILLDGKAVGYGGVSWMDNEEELYLEYVELYPSFRGQHFYRNVLKAIAEHFRVNTFFLESSINNKAIYDHFGAEETSPPDEVREMWSYRLSLDNIRAKED